MKFRFFEFFFSFQYKYFLLLHFENAQFNSMDVISTEDILQTARDTKRAKTIKSIQRELSNASVFSERDSIATGWAKETISNEEKNSLVTIMAASGIVYGVSQPSIASEIVMMCFLSLFSSVLPAIIGAVVSRSHPGIFNPKEEMERMKNHENLRRILTCTSEDKSEPSMFLRFFSLQKMKFMFFEVF